MNDRIATWQAEHANFSRLLDLVDAQIALFHRGERPDYELMLDVMHYMTHYPDRFHHPREDLACQVLAERDAGFRDAVGDLAHQHVRIADTGTRLVKDLDAIVDGAFMPRAAVESDAEAYTRTLRQHMRREEEVIFPALDRTLAAADWARVGARIHPGADPVFGESVDGRYAALHKRIAEQVGCGCAPVG
jgi:hemerythrin-like domain-containing protein